MEEYKTLFMKMTIDSPNEPKVFANLQLCDVEVSLVLNCLILLLEVVHSFIKFRHIYDVFLCDFVASLKIC